MQTRDYLLVAPGFMLGKLTTERRHPLSLRLSQTAARDLREAIKICKRIDVLALQRLRERSQTLFPLMEAVQATTRAGKRIFLCGCGATGRLSLSLETLGREGVCAHDIVAFMAGGDTALIRSIENFEDHAQYGAAQLEELGFEEGDMFMGMTEGGETSFVIGATKRSVELSSNRPWFLYCNPDEELKGIERCRDVLDDDAISKVSLCVGPMTIAGSTRMQASTVLMLAVGLALMCATREEVVAELDALIDAVQKTEFGFLHAFIRDEARVYHGGGHMLYKTDAYGITVLTDLTERAPTFSLAPFENTRHPEQPASLCYLVIAGSADAKTAWEQVLHRPPRCLGKEEFLSFAGKENFFGYDISERAAQHRMLTTGRRQEHVLSITRAEGGFMWRFGEHEHLVSLSLPLLSEHIMLKLMLNTHSTLVMGVMGRYHGNLMTYVRPSNLKLIDRSIRYVQELYEERMGKSVPYERVAEEVFAIKDGLAADEPIVLKALERLL